MKHNVVAQKMIPARIVTGRSF